MIKIKKMTNFNGFEKIDYQPNVYRTGIYFEVAYYVGSTQEIATKGDVYTSTFDTEKEALKFYNLKKNDTDKHMFWITVRDSNGDLIDDVLTN